MGKNSKYLLLIILLALTKVATPRQNLHYKTEALGYASTYGEYAPYMMSSNRHGELTQSRGAQLRLSAVQYMDTTRRFTYGYGADVIAGVRSATNYEFYNIQSPEVAVRENRPSALYIQQLYGEVKFRGVFLTIGMKEYNSIIVNHALSSGDLTFSGNTRPIPQVRVGFVDFQNIPFTNGWVQIEGVYSFGKSMDNKWLENHFNYRDVGDHLCLDSYYSYKRCYFRTKPSQPFSVTVGMQAGMQLGGTSMFYNKGELIDKYHDHITFKNLLQTIFPTAGSAPGNYYKEGNSVGSWDILGRYRLDNGTEVKAYYESPFEDGSGIGKLNGFDGLYGIEYKAPCPGYVTGAVLEYFDFRNQSGPIHFDSSYNPGGEEHRPGNATGKDDYYNNFQYSGYQYYGMSIGTPLLKSPFYNLNGSNLFLHNRVYGFHAAVKGQIMKGLQYRAMASWRTSLGSYDYPVTEKIHDFSAMLEVAYDVEQLPGLRIKAQVAGDKGKLYGDNFGAVIGVSYSGLLKF